MDAHTEAHSVGPWVEKLAQGECIALVSDAGTPSISDPGSLLVAEALKAGIRVVPVPGVSAVTALLSVSGFRETSFTFRGFFPRKLEERKKELQQMGASPVVPIGVWFESPHRILESLELIQDVYPDAQAVAGKELTKIYERLFFGTSAEVAQEVRQEVEREGQIGEWCFALHFPALSKGDSSEDAASTDTQGWMKALKCLIEAKVPVSEAARRVSQEFGTAKKIAYEAALRLSGKKTDKGG
jgi:16S rRNA (cytidine1402-2'-O)-methyltransferase